MMTPLENETLRDGFLLALVCIVQRRGGAGAIRAVLFDGGRPVDAYETVSPGPLPPSAYLDLRRFAARVVSPPHVLVGCGAGWNTVLVDALGEHAGAFRLLDLQATAVVFGMAPDEEDDGPPFAAFEDLLWRLLRQAGRRGMSWPSLLSAAGDAVDHAPFEQYAFDEAHLRAVPEAPGVYLLRDGGGRVLYVGKSGNLARRLWDYFRATRTLDAKLRRIRDQVHDFEYTRVGSELEALLQEYRLIEEHAPPVNVQRRMAEGASRYNPPLLPIALLEPAVAKGRVELFVFGPALPAIQRRVDPGRPPRRAMASILGFALGKTSRLPASARAQDWGTAGREICLRYFGRSRSRAQWVELHHSLPIEALAGKLLRCMETILEQAPDPGEFVTETEPDP